MKPPLPRCYFARWSGAGVVQDWAVIRGGEWGHWRVRGDYNGVNGYHALAVG